MVNPQYPGGLSPKQNKTQDLLLESGTPHGCYLFAVAHPSADIPALQKVVLAFGDPYECYRFARRVRRADVLLIARHLASRARAEAHTLTYLRALAKEFPTLFTPEVLADLGLGVTL